MHFRTLIITRQPGLVLDNRDRVRTTDVVGLGRALEITIKDALKG